MASDPPVPAFRAKIRSFKNEKLQLEWGRLSDREFRLMAVMTSAADDEGRLGADPETLRVRTFGFDTKVKTREVEHCLRALQRRWRLIRIYAVNGMRFAQLLDWDQRIDAAHFVKSRIPPPPGGSSGKPAPTSKQLTRSTRTRGTSEARASSPERGRASSERTRASAEAQASSGSDRIGKDRRGSEDFPPTPPAGGVASDSRPS